MPSQEFELDVIVPFVNAADDLAGCLEALGRQDVGLRAIVVDRVGGADDVLADRDWVEHIVVGSGASIPEMREIAVRAARAPAVAQIEDHVVVPDGWARALLDALGEDHDVVGGSIVNAATVKLVDRAAFLCEYSALLPPLPAGPSGGVPGNNVIYRRDVLTRYEEVLAIGGWENLLHDKMREDGVELIMAPEISVGHKMHYTFWLYFSQRYLYSRSYAGKRFQSAGLGKRLAAGLAAFALPPLMLFRIVRTVMAKGGHNDDLLKSLPFLSLFVLAWGAGEVVGYVFGPGNALARVR